jgi:hypothetical protein
MVLLHVLSTKTIASIHVDLVGSSSVSFHATEVEFPETFHAIAVMMTTVHRTRGVFCTIVHTSTYLCTLISVQFRVGALLAF